MSIFDEINLAIATRKPTQTDMAVCDKYKMANELFEQLIQAGVITRRGCRLCPIENKICVDTQINHSKNT